MLPNALTNVYMLNFLVRFCKIFHYDIHICLNILTFHCKPKSNSVCFVCYFCLVSIVCDVLWSRTYIIVLAQASVT